MGKIYKIANDINDKIYVGETLNSLEERWKGHLAALNVYRNGKYDHETKLYAAMNKYGEDHFKIELIEEYDDANDRKSLGIQEQYWIAALDSIKHGYNISPGGEGGALFKGHTHSEAARKKQSDNCWIKGKKQSDDLIKKRSVAKTRYYECIKTGEIVFGRKSITHDFKWWIELSNNEPIDEIIRLDMLSSMTEEMNLRIANGYRKMGETNRKRNELRRNGKVNK